MKSAIITALFACAAMAQVPVQLLVTAEAHKQKEVPAISKQDVVVHEGKEQVPVSGWQSASAGLQLLLLVDDGLESDFGLQIDDLRKFLRAQPASAEVGVEYLRNGTTVSAHAFTVDHDAAAKSIRLPLGTAGAGASPYVAISERIHKWPAFAGRREILLISSGVDSLYFGGDLQNPYLLRAIEDAQKAGIPVHSIYYSGGGHAGHSYYQINLSQSYLSRLGDETGGEPYWQGFQNPVSFQPYLDDLSKRLQNQYLVSFNVAPGGKSELRPVKVRTEKQGAELTSANRVWVPAER